MTVLRSLPWPLILALGAAALLRPLVSIVEYQLGTDSGPAVPIALTIVTTALWVIVVGYARTPRPVLTLVAVGIVYAITVTLLSGILSPILTGELQGPIAQPFAIIPLLLFNAGWGLVAGFLALLVRRLRGGRDRAVAGSAS